MHLTMTCNSRYFSSVDTHSRAPSTSCRTEHLRGLGEPDAATRSRTQRRRATLCLLGAGWVLAVAGCGTPVGQGDRAPDPDTRGDIPAWTEEEVPPGGVDPGVETPGEDPGPSIDGPDATDETGTDPVLDPLPVDPGTDEEPLDAGSEPGPAVTVPEGFVGVCPLDADPSEEHWDRLAAWGVGRVRQGFFWEWIARPDGSFDFSWPDRYLEAAERRGIQVLIVLDYDHPLLHSPGAPRPHVPTAGLPLWLDYVRAMVGRYRERAFGFEVWNEPNLAHFWAGPREDFLALVEATLPVIREAAPDRPVGLAGFSLLPLDWLEALDARGLLARADALSFHPYWVDAEGALEMVALVQNWLGERSLPLQVWLTEYGWPTGGDYLTATTLEEQAERLVRFLPGAAALGVQGAWWYASLDWRDPDQVEEPENSEGFFGLGWPTAGDKPAAGALAVLSRVLPGSVVADDVPLTLGIPRPFEVLGFRRPDFSTWLVVTNPAQEPRALPLSGDFQVLWPPGVSEGPLGWEIPPNRSLIAVFGVDEAP